MSMDYVLETKDIGWLIGLKKKKTKIDLYDAYKKLSSELKTHTDQK